MLFLQKYRQDGIALATTLIFLLVVTVLAVAGTSNSALALKMSANMQEAYRSFQAAEAGIYATLGLAGGQHNPFQRQARVDQPFRNVPTYPLRNLATNPSDATVVVGVVLIAIERDCPRPAAERGGTSVGVLDCDFYRVKSEHDEPGKARTQVELGVIKTVLAGNG